MHSKLSLFQYDFLEKQLHDKREDKPKHTGLFAKPGKLEKGGSKSSSLDLTDSAESSQHIRREMEELKTKLDELDKGENWGYAGHTYMLCFVYSRVSYRVSIFVTIILLKSATESKLEVGIGHW